MQFDLAFSLKIIRIIVFSSRETALPARRVGSGRLTGRDVEPVPAKDRPLQRAPATQRERTFDREPQRNDRGGGDRHVERNERSDRNGRTFPTRSDPRDKGPSETKDRRNFDRSGYDRDYSGRGDRYNVSILYRLQLFI